MKFGELRSARATDSTPLCVTRRSLFATIPHSQLVACNVHSYVRRHLCFQIGNVVQLMSWSRGQRRQHCTLESASWTPYFRFPNSYQLLLRFLIHGGLCSRASPTLAVPFEDAVPPWPCCLRTTTTMSCPGPGVPSPLGPAVSGCRPTRPCCLRMLFYLGLLFGDYQRVPPTG